MNIQNIVSLSERLVSLEFPDLRRALAKHICFKPEAFFLAHQVTKNGNTVSFRLSFECLRPADCYRFAFYDAVLQSDDVGPQVVNGVDTAILTERMSKVDWRKAFDLAQAQPITVANTSAFEDEMEIEKIMESLGTLASTEDGRAGALALKHRFWSGTAYHGMVGNLPAVKNKSAVCQRFYLLDGQPGISLNEAYRYLHNRWLEKEMSAQAKLRRESITGSLVGENAGNRSLRNKRSKRPKVSTSEP